MHHHFRPLAVLSAVAAAACLSAPASAQFIFTANLTHDQEAPPGGDTPPTTSSGAPRPLPTGTGMFVLNPSMTAMTMDVTIFDIDVTGTQTADTNDNLVAAHIHVGAPPRSTAGVRWGFFGAPDNDNNPDQLVVTPSASGVGGRFTSIWDAPEGNAGTTLATNLPGIFAGLAYVNFHTVQFGGGELRGQLILVTPEPGAYALLGGMLIPAVILFRRRRG